MPPAQAAGSGPTKAHCRNTRQAPDGAALFRIGTIRLSALLASSHCGLLRTEAVASDEWPDDGSTAVDQAAAVARCSRLPLLSLTRKRSLVQIQYGPRLIEPLFGYQVTNQVTTRYNGSASTSATTQTDYQQSDHPSSPSHSTMPALQRISPRKLIYPATTLRPGKGCPSGRPDSGVH